MKQTELEKEVVDLAKEYAEISGKSVQTVFRNSLNSSNYDHINMVIQGKRTMSANSFGVVKSNSLKCLKSNPEWVAKRIEAVKNELTELKTTLKNLEK